MITQITVDKRAAEDNYIDGGNRPVYLVKKGGKVQRTHHWSAVAAVQGRSTGEGLKPLRMEGMTFSAWLEVEGKVSCQ